MSYSRSDEGNPAGLQPICSAADADYRLVVRDCCSDKDQEVHRILMDKVFTRQATVATAQEIIAALPAAK